MFSGLIEALAPVKAVIPEGAGMRIVIAVPPVLDDLEIGASVAINGCCLTVVALSETTMEFQAGEETLSKTTLGSLREGASVNLERALALGDRLGGHLVTGHVDGTGRVTRREEDDEWCTLRLSAPRSLLRQMASKGSIAVDGVSLTLVDVTDREFSVALIPHTLQVTTLGRLQEGDAVNLETDLLAKYVQRQLETQQWGQTTHPPDQMGE